MFGSDKTNVPKSPPLLQGHDISVNKCLLFTGDNINFIKGALFLDFLSNS